MQYIRLAIRLSAIVALTLAAALFILTTGDIKQSYLQYRVFGNVVALTPTTNPNTGGTGFQVVAPSGDRFVLTNAHVCRISQNGVLLARGQYSRAIAFLQIQEISRKADLCILSPLPNAEGLNLASQASQTREIATVGHPHLEALTVSRGYITNRQYITLTIAVNTTSIFCTMEMGGDFLDVSDQPGAAFFGIENVCVKRYDSMRTSSVAYPGNSGSPVVDMYGDVVGVLFAGSGRNNYGYIVTLDDIKDFLKDR